MIRSNFGKLALPFRKTSQMLSTWTPPLHFSNPDSIPKTYEAGLERNSSTTHAESERLKMQELEELRKDPKNNSIKEFTSLIALCILGYFAVDNYVNRIKLERLNQETTAINLKTLQIQQANFLNAKKQKDLQILLERKDHDKRCFKMSLHIALLRKQLIELGVEPAKVEEAVKEFERSVKMDNSLKNISGQTLWIDDNSRTYSFEKDHAHQEHLSNNTNSI